VARELVARRDDLWLSRSWTTRPIRPSERGDEYVFVSRADFERAIAEGRFLEWAEFHGNLYGTPHPTPGVGQRALLEIEVQGAAQVLDHEPDALVILLVPPSDEELMRRLRERGDLEDQVQSRLQTGSHEVEIGRAMAHHVVVNDNLDAAVGRILSILVGPPTSPGR
jgi:guanylate kinase